MLIPSIVRCRPLKYASWAAILLGGGAAMVGSFVLLTGRSGSAQHILEIGFGDTDQYTFGQLGLDIRPEDRGVYLPHLSQAHRHIISSSSTLGWLTSLSLHDARFSLHRLLRQHVATTALHLLHDPQRPVHLLLRRERMAKLRRQVQDSTRQLASRPTALNIFPLPPTPVRTSTHGYVHDAALDPVAVHLLDRPCNVQLKWALERAFVSWD